MFTFSFSTKLGIPNFLTNCSPLNNKAFRSWDFDVDTYLGYFKNLHYKKLELFCCQYPLINHLWVEAGADLFGKFGARLSQCKAIFHTYPLQGLPIFYKKHFEIQIKICTHFQAKLQVQWKISHIGFTSFLALVCICEIDVRMCDWQIFVRNEIGKSSVN